MCKKCKSRGAAPTPTHNAFSISTRSALKDKMLGSHYLSLCFCPFNPNKMLTLFLIVLPMKYHIEHLTPIPHGSVWGCTAEEERLHSMNDCYLHTVPTKPTTWLWPLTTYTDHRGACPQSEDILKKKKKTTRQQAEEMSPWSRAWTSLAEDRNSTLTEGGSQTLRISALRDAKAILGLQGYLAFSFHIPHTDIYIYK